MILELDDSQTSRLRLMSAAKALIAERGYESTSTASIVRAAGTSESQLVRYFGGKAGLLEAIFEAGWEEINPGLQRDVISAATAREALMKSMKILLETFEEDPDLAMVFFFEGKRIRGGEHGVLVSEGFRMFSQVTDSLIKRAKAEGTIREDLSEAAIRSGLISSLEGMIRDRLIARRSGEEDPFSSDEIMDVIGSILDGLAPRKED